MPSILLIQFRHNPIAADLERSSIARELAGRASVEARSVFTEFDDIERLVHLIDGVILGGSGDLDFDGARTVSDPVRIEAKHILKQLRPVLDFLFTHDIPMLGICFGHQLIAAYHGVIVRHDALQSKTKTHEIELTTAAEEHPMFANLPKRFAVQYGHKDIVTALPLGATLLAHAGDTCQCAAVAYSTNVVTTQFHPELSLEDLYTRVTHIPNYLPQGVTVDDVYKATPVAGEVLRNFAKIVG